MSPSGLFDESMNSMTIGSGLDRFCTIVAWLGGPMHRRIAKSADLADVAARHHVVVRPCALGFLCLPYGTIDRENVGARLHCNPRCNPWSARCATCNPSSTLTGYFVTTFGLQKTLILTLTLTQAALKTKSSSQL